VTSGVNWTTNRIVGQRADPQQLNGTGAQLVDKFTKIQIEKERPDWRGTVTTDYLRSEMNVLLRASYYGSFHSAPGLCDACDQEFGARTLFDVEAGRQFSGIKWSIGVRNIFDTFPTRIHSTTATAFSHGLGRRRSATTDGSSTRDSTCSALDRSGTNVDLSSAHHSVLGHFPRVLANFSGRCEEDRRRRVAGTRHTRRDCVCLDRPLS
jgi:hypothetical protein